MCTNSGLIETLECYMEDLIECFEDFVTKSLVILSLAIGALMVMVAYALKVAIDRNLFNATGREITANSLQPEPGGMTVSESPTTGSTMGSRNCPNRETCNQNEKTRQTRSNDVRQQNIQNERITTNATNIGILPKNSSPSFNEKALLSIGLSNCCSDNCSKKSLRRNHSASRINIPSQPTCIPNCHLSKSRPCSRYMKMKSSCCSMCCADEDKR